MAIRYLDGNHTPMGMHDWAPVVNLGLPKTGTSSFVCAAAQVGLSPLHSTRYIDPETGNLATAHWLPADKAAKRPGPLIHWLDLALTPGTAESTQIQRFGALADNPFYLSYSDEPLRVRIARVAPRASFVCTVRSADSWAAAIQRHGSDYAGASYLANWYNLTLPYRNTLALQAAWAAHMARECAGVPRLDLSSPDDQLWATFCAALPPSSRAQKPCTGTSERQPWPHSNTHGTKGLSVRNLSRSCSFHLSDHESCARSRTRHSCIR
jgi:hypothetical protein